MNQKPKIFNNGERVNPITHLKGKTLEVYAYLLEHIGHHGVREIQRSLGYKSPSVVLYHLSILLDENLANKTEDGRYYITMEIDQQSVISSHLRFYKYWVPRSVAYAISLVFIVAIATGFAISGYSDILAWSLVVIPPLCFIIILLILDSLRMSKSFIAMNNPKI